MAAEGPAARREAAALTFAMTFPAVMAWVYFLALSPPAAPPGERVANPALQAAYALSKAVQFSFPLLYLAIYERQSLRPRRPTPRGLLLGLAFGLLVAAATLLLYHAGLAGMLERIGMGAAVREKVREMGAATPGRYLLLAVFLSVAHSLMEEYYWRWFVFGRLRRLLARWPAIALSSLAFMAHHVIVLYVLVPGHFLTAVVPLSLGVAAGGAAWAWLYDRTGSVYAAWLSHLLVDAGIMAVGYDLCFGVG